MSRLGRHFVHTIYVLLMVLYCFLYWLYQGTVNVFEFSFFFFLYMIRI